MYTGENKTAQSSQSAFAEALLRLLEVRPYAQITVSALCQESGISRQTFYSLFQNKENVLRYAIEHLYRYPEALTEPAGPCSAAALAHVLSIYVDANYDFLRLLVQQDLLFIFYECCRDWLMQRQDTAFAAVSPGLRKYVSAHVISMFIGIASIYVSEPRREPEYLEDLFRNLLSGAYF